VVVRASRVEPHPARGRGRHQPASSADPIHVGRAPGGRGR
jgi:hypothetical protein